MRSGHSYGRAKSFQKPLPLLFSVAHTCVLLLCAQDVLSPVCVQLCFGVYFGVASAVSLHPCGGVVELRLDE